VIMDNVRIGKEAVVRRAILDKNVTVPDGAQVGVDLGADRALSRHRVGHCRPVQVPSGGDVVAATQHRGIRRGTPSARSRVSHPMLVGSCRRALAHPGDCGRPGCGTGP